MEEELQFNTKLYSFEGIIGRHGYFLNLIIIASIALFFTLPLQLWFCSNIHTMTDIFSPNEMFYRTPILIKLWFLLGTFGTFVLSSSNVWRRLNDINGGTNKIINISVISLFFLYNLSIIFPIKYICLIGFISFIVGMIILLKRGKITKTYPYDYSKEFNWGAYIGTWIWGLFNKSYKTLWILLLGLTPWGPYYQLYCGLKGNEWAFKNKKWDDVTAFNRSQEKQTTVFAILLCLVIPILYFLLIFSLVAGFMFTTFDDVKNNPQKAEQTMTKLEDSMTKLGSVYFDSFILTPDENKYYVSSSDWNHYAFNEKREIIDMAASLASIERQKEYKKLHPGKHKSFTKQKELQRTKIYSTETNHLLGEFDMGDVDIETASLKDYVKAGMNAYKFYQDKD